MVNLLDEYIPVVEGSEINDDPLHPISRFAIETIKIKWVIKHQFLGFIDQIDLQKN